MKGILIATLLSSLAAPALADAPYAGQQTRPIKALSAKQVDDYLAGRGQGYAKAAELNHYPGPRHVLDLADALALTPAQRQRTAALFDAMQAEAAALGRQRVDREASLDRAFAGGEITAPQLKQALAEIASLEGRLRFAHLSTHLEQRALLSPAQVQRYDQLRGYRGEPAPHTHAH